MKYFLAAIALIISTNVVTAQTGYTPAPPVVEEKTGLQPEKIDPKAFNEGLPNGQWVTGQSQRNCVRGETGFKSMIEEIKGELYFKGTNQLTNLDWSMYLFPTPSGTPAILVIEHVKTHDMYCILTGGSIEPHKKESPKKKSGMYEPNLDKDLGLEHRHWNDV